MSNASTPLEERISALMDGALDAHEHPDAVRQILADPDGLMVWHRYHVLGDTLRSAELTPGGDDQRFWAKLSNSLAQEPQRPQQGAASAVVRSAVHDWVLKPAPETPGNVSRVAANSPLWHWKLLAGAACSVLVAVVGLGLWSETAAPGIELLATKAAPQVAQALAAVEGGGGLMLRDPDLDALIAAHQQLGGHSALQAPSGFLRNATYQGAAR